MTDVANRLNVSQSVISRMLNQKLELLPKDEELEDPEYQLPSMIVTWDCRLVAILVIHAEAWEEDFLMLKVFLYRFQQ